MIRLTNSGWMFLGVCILLYFSSITSQSSLLLTLIGIFVGCFILNFILAWRTIKNLEVNAPEETRVAEGEGFSQPWKVINRGVKSVGFISIQSGKDAVLRIANLAPGTTANIVPDLLFQRRGVHRYSAMELASTYPFGLVQSFRRLDLPGEVVVHPAIYPTQAPRGAGYDVMLGGKFHGKRRVTSGTYFAGVRPMQPGDPLKQIHWKSSAKGQGIMVKTFEEELSGRVSIVMDAGHSGDAKVLDDCVRAAGSLIFAALDQGDHVEWIDLANFELLLIPPFADGDEILDRLARVPAVRDCLTAEGLEKATARLSRKSAVCFVLTEGNAAVERAIHVLQNRHQRVAVYLPENSRTDFGDVPVYHYGAAGIGAADALSGKEKARG